MTKEGEILERLYDAMLSFDSGASAETVKAAKELIEKGGG